MVHNTAKVQNVIAAAPNKRVGSHCSSQKLETKAKTRRVTKAQGQGSKGAKKLHKGEEPEDDNGYMTLSVKLTKEERTGKNDPIFKEKRGFHALLDRPPCPEDEEARQARVRLEMGKYDMSLDNFITVNERPEPQSAPKVLQNTWGAPYPRPEANRLRFGDRPEVAGASLGELMESPLAKFLTPPKEPYAAANICEKPGLKPMARDASDYPDNRDVARRKRQLEGTYAGECTVNRDREGVPRPRRGRSRDGGWKALEEGVPSQFHNSRTPRCFANVRPTHLVEYNEVSGSIRRRKRTATEAGLGEGNWASGPAAKHVQFAN